MGSILDPDHLAACLGKDDQVVELLPISMVPDYANRLIAQGKLLSNSKANHASFARSSGIAA